MPSASSLARTSTETETENKHIVEDVEQPLHVSYSFSCVVLCLFTPQYFFTAVLQNSFGARSLNSLVPPCIKGGGEPRQSASAQFQPVESVETVESMACDCNMGRIPQNPQPLLTLKSLTISKWCTLSVCRMVAMHTFRASFCSSLEASANLKRGATTENRILRRPWLV